MTVTTVTATVSAGSALSNSVDCSTAQPVRVRMPAAWSGGRQGVITFQISTDNVNFMDYFQSDGREVSSAAMPGTTVRVDHPIGGKGTTYIKIRTGSRDAPVIQANRCDFIVVLEA